MSFELLMVTLAIGFAIGFLHALKHNRYKPMVVRFALFMLCLTLAVIASEM